jgi:hypothetical protein
MTELDFEKKSKSLYVHMYIMSMCAAGSSYSMQMVIDATNSTIVYFDKGILLLKAL